ncbi:MAG TPA: YkgJ family cysteine cluster protein, partial [Nitrososphaera sp.]|nr:YkgJ family cysteine cluster protein [Nitrososphaera sp.]
EEKMDIERLAKKIKVSVRIVPRLAIGKESPEKIIAYQMMGKNDDGDLCPFLDVESAERSPHGGFKCRIYSSRPLACKAYPVIDAGKTVTLDKHCQFCRKHPTESASVDGLQTEIEALAKIKASVAADNNLRVWRYATATGKADDRHKLLPEGWVIEC